MIVLWDVLISTDVQEFLEKQDKNLAERLRKGLKRLKCDNPFLFLEHFETHSFYKYRIGEYRALIDIDFKNKLVKVRILDHRSIVYKRRL